MNTDIPVDLDIAKEEILRYFDTGQDTYAQRFLDSIIQELCTLREKSKAPVLEAPAVDSGWLVTRCEEVMGRDYDSDRQNTALNNILSQAKATISEWSKLKK